MQRLVKGVKGLLLWCVRLTVLPLCEVVALVLGAVPGNIAHGVFERHGFHLLRKHYYLPVPDREDLGPAFWESRSELVGMQMNEEYALHLLDEVFPPYLREFAESFPLHESPGRNCRCRTRRRAPWRRRSSCCAPTPATTSPSTRGIPSTAGSRKKFVTPISNSLKSRSSSCVFSCK